jgi:hypothetical protein
MAALVLISCSATKKTEGSLVYRFDDSILSILDKDTRNKVYQKRQEVFNYIKKGEIVDLVRAGGNRKDHNIELKEGPDLSPGYSLNNNLYRPAYERYYGRFYKKVGNEFFVEAILSENIHTLVVSGLYGLITLEEPIQEYSCHLDDNIVSAKDQPDYLSSQFKARVADLWKDGKDSLFYECLKQYILQINDKAKADDHKINIVIDLLSEYSYQRVFQWNKLSNWLNYLGIKKYHRVTPLIKEPYFLPILGEYYKNNIIEIKNYDKLPSNDFPLKTEGGSIYFEKNILRDPYIIDKLKNIITLEIWNKMDIDSQEELIQGERLFEEYDARSPRVSTEPADRNINYFIAVEIELCKVFKKVKNKEGEIVCGNLGDYWHHLRKGSLRNQLSQGCTGLISQLNDIRNIRNDVSHPAGINRAQLLAARNLIIGKTGILANLMMIKTN